ncbi:MAG: hypothetical protein M5U07_12590 [Xanthobacteraceae bacterium]|nr:hypothetical protein [Xanthobacteraceae bacterium]
MLNSNGSFIEDRHSSRPPPEPCVVAAGAISPGGRRYRPSLDDRILEAFFFFALGAAVLIFTSAFDVFALTFDVLLPLRRGAFDRAAAAGGAKRD